MRVHAAPRLFAPAPAPATTGFATESARIARRCAVALVAANVVGAVLVFVLGVYVVPAPRIANHGDLDLYNLILLGACLVVLFPIGSVFARRRWQEISVWMREDRVPTPAERDATIGFPFRLVRKEAALWAMAGVPFVVLNGFWSTTVAIECGIEIFLGGLTTCALAFLLDERFSRPLVAEALERTPLERSEPGCFGVRAHLTLSWVAGAAVPLASLVLLGVTVLAGVPASHVRIGVAVVLLGVVGVVVGLLANVTTARMLSDPLNSLRQALGQVEGGNLDVGVQVNDASEVGMLQSGFNRMMHGLRERDRLRDLFGRHVGEDVAREALECDAFELGGETREAAVLFVDLVGSTAMAASWEPHDVVAELNAFFAIVVDCVTLHGGWVNKFEGDAALCVFGAPGAHPDAAGAALATARALHSRLENELPDVRAAIGVSAGTVVAGNVGTAERYEYTVIGDPVNEAARLTELAKSTPGRLLASDAALERARPRERVRWRTGEQVELRGRSRPTVVATVA
jgi:adenylate cyclase